jgi:hypothetical protein
MDFFEYASIASWFTNSLTVQLIIGGLCFAIVFIFQAVALFIIAKREGYKNKWMAFVPFFNTYYIGVCAQKNKIYRIDAKTVGLVTAIFEAVLFAAYVVYNVAVSLVSEYVLYTETETILGTVMEPYLSSAVPSNLSWAAWMYNYFDSYILTWVNLLYVLCEVCLLIAFFQTYACRRYVLFTVTSILFPIQGILFFVVRNNKGINYREYVLAEQARQYRMYQQYQQQRNFNDNPYNRNPYDGNYNNNYNNSYNNNNYNNGYNNQNGGYNNQSGASQPDDPFDGLGGNSNNSNNTNGSNSSGGSPFDDFDDKN